jgi:hypothetical protein
VLYTDNYYIMSSWEENARQFLLEEEEDDDNLFFGLIHVVLSALKEEKRLVHACSLPSVVKVREILGPVWIHCSFFKNKVLDIVSKNWFKKN